MNQAELIELIDGCLKEDRRTQELLYKRYSNRMWGVCLRYSRSREEAEDILQEGFMKVFDNIGKFKFEGSFEGWVRRIMVNTALRHYSKSVFKEELANDDEEIDAVVDPDALANISEKELLRVIDELPEGYRVVFNLYVIEGYDHKEIAEMLSIAESTSRSQLTKARLWLQKRLNKDKKQNKLFLFFLMAAGTDPFDEQVRRKLVNYSPEAPSHVWNNIIEQRSFYYRMMRLLRRNGLTFGFILLFTGLLAGVSYSFISGEKAYAQRGSLQRVLAFNAGDGDMEQDNSEDLFSDFAEAGQAPASFAAFSANNGSVEQQEAQAAADGKEAGAEKNGDADHQAKEQEVKKIRKPKKDALKNFISDIGSALNGNNNSSIFKNAALVSNDPVINSILVAGSAKSSQNMKASGTSKGSTAAAEEGSSINNEASAQTTATIATTPSASDNDEQILYASNFAEGFVPVTPQLPGATIDSIGGGENASPKEPTKTGRETWADRLTIYAVGSPVVVKKSFRASSEDFKELCDIRSNAEKMNMGYTAGVLGELRITEMMSFRTGAMFTRFTSTFGHSNSSEVTNSTPYTDTIYMQDPFEPATPVIVYDTLVTTETVTDTYTSTNSYSSLNIPFLVQSQFGIGNFKLYSSVGPMLNVSYMQKGMLVNNDRQVSDISEDAYRKNFNVLLYAGAGAKYAISKRVCFMLEPHYTYNLNSVARKGGELKQNFHTWGMMAGIGIDL